MRIYFMGVCGTAMGNAALLMRGQGHDVLGSDGGIFPPMSELLERSGVAVLEGYDNGRLRDINPDLVVVGNVISRGNPEVEWLLRTNSIAYTSLPSLLHDRMLKHRCNIVVTGTHGKTTTTALTASLLCANGCNPGYFIGGVPRNLPAGAMKGDEEAPFVIEGDEYDCAFFDKRSKFMHYRPRILVVNNLDFDHADIFRDLADIQRSFKHLFRLVPDDGWIIVNGDDGNITSLLPVPWTRTIQVGESAHNDLRLLDFAESSTETQFRMEWRGDHWASVCWQLPGRFNMRNAGMAALATALALGSRHPLGLSLGPLADAVGVKRRNEILFEDERVTVIEDFAHHPEAVSQTVGSLRARFPDGRIVACFEPRSNTARSDCFQREFGHSFDGAHDVYLAPVGRPESIVSGRCLDTARLASELCERGIRAEAFGNNHALLERLTASFSGESEVRWIVCFLSNGSFDGIMRGFVETLKRPDTCERRIEMGGRRPGS